MADIFVRKTGNNSTGDGSTGNPYLTISKGIAVAGNGDRVIVGDGTYSNEFSTGASGLVIKTGIIVKAENTPTLTGTTWSAAHTCIIDQQNLKDYAFLATGGKTDFSIEGFELKNCKAALTISDCNDFSVKHNLIHDCASNGISVNGGCDLIWVEGNEVHTCASAESGRSAISVLSAQPTTKATPSDGYRIHILNNFCHDILRPQTSDCNGIIIDKLHYWTNKFQTAGGVPHETLVKGNYCSHVRGSGIRIMASLGCTVEYNTCYDTRVDVDPNSSAATTRWVGGISSQWSQENIYRYNIGMATKNLEAGFTNVGSSASAYAFTQPSTGNTFTSNIFYNSNGTGDDVYGVTGAQLPAHGVDGNQIGVDPLFVNAAAENFETQAGSPARGAAAGGLDIGAWQSGGAGPADVVPVTAPVLTIPDPVSGGSLSVAIGTYSGAVDLVHTVQFFANGIWNDAGVTLSGTDPKTGTLPTVTASTTFRVQERYTGEGAFNKANPSNQIDVLPVEATPNEAPVNTVLPAISGTTSVGSTLTVSTGTWTGRPSPTFTYQWKRDAVNISGATSASYLLVAGDSGTVITAAVTATNSEGNATATSAGTAAITGSTPDDDLTGLTARVGVLEGQLAALTANLATLAAHVEVVDAALSDEIVLAKARVSTLELDFGSSGTRLTDIEVSMAELQVIAVENDQAIDSFSELQDRVITLLEGGRLRLYLS